YLAELRPCCRQHLRDLMESLHAVFTELRVRWWLDYGTLLGAVRNPLTTWADYHWLPQDGRAAGPLHPGIVPHDKDADLGVLGEDWPKLQRAAARLRKLGHHVALRPAGQSMK